jgi:hypothetical protein
MKKINALSLWLFLCSFALLVAVTVAQAADAGAVPGFGESVSAIITSITTKAPFAVVLVAVFQLLRTNEVLPILSKLSGIYCSIVIAAITVAGYVLNAYLGSHNLGAAAIEGLFTSGGAMLIYDQIRAIPKKV